MARIRTIKPEFWTSETLASISDRARLLAIALLNHCDDQGYFLASVPLVRAACFPFDDESLTTHGALTELSNIGYIEIRMSHSGKSIGRVTSFCEHQVINRPTPSKFAGLFEDSDCREVLSMTDHGSISDESQRERNREQGKEQGKESKAASNDADVSSKSRKRKTKARQYSAEFESWWCVYWNRSNKAAASDSLSNAIERIIDDTSIAIAVDRSTALEWLVARTKRYAACRPRTVENLHGATYLNDDRFNDELPSDAVASRPRPSFAEANA